MKTIDKTPNQNLILFCWRISAAHTIAYTIAGFFGLIIMNYKIHFVSQALSMFMRPINSPWVAIGPSLQIIIGIFIGLILFPIQDSLIFSKKGLFKIFLLIFGLSIFAPQVPGPGSVEGIIYTNIPVKYHLLGLPETIIYSILFSVIVYCWNNHPKKIWNICMATGLGLVVLLSIAGLLSSIGLIAN